jgi:hypothetical protein
MLGSEVGGIDLRSHPAAGFGIITFDLRLLAATVLVYQLVKLVRNTGRWDPLSVYEYVLGDRNQLKSK